MSDAAWVRAGLAWARQPDATGPGWDRAAWFRVVVAERPTLPPTGCVVDLAAMALGAPDVPRRMRAGDAALRQALAAWDDEVLGRLRGDPQLLRMQDAVAALPPERRGDGAGQFAAEVLEAIGGEGAVVAPGAIRRALEPGAVAVDADAALARGYRALTDAARQVRVLIPPAAVERVANLPVLHTHEARVALRQIAQVAADGAPAAPPWVRNGSVPHAGASVGAYPIGGFAAIQTTGALENLVPSELVYMDDGAHVDLFDLRWADGELLYYARDEALVHRAGRALLIELDAGLERARTPGPDGVQPVVAALGRVVALVRLVAHAYGEQALRVRIHAPMGAVAPPFALELPLVALLLRELTERRVLTMAREDADSAQRWLSGHAHTHATDHVVVCAEGRSGPGVRVLAPDFDPAAVLATMR